MKFRKLTPDGDWTFGHGHNDIAKDIYAIELEVATRVKEWANDWFADMNRGIDYTNLLEIGQRARLLFAIKATILTCYGVIGVAQDANGKDIVDVYVQNGRNYYITYTVNTIYSQSFASEINLL
jgi:hypothetical protein